jgi:trans-aconitate 2-methyltransferase
MAIDGQAREGSPRPLDWDAATYDRVADPQESWAREIIARMDLKGDEVVLDAGCGSGRVTALLLQALPRGRVIGVDASPAMIARARAALAAELDCGRLALFEQSLLGLALPEAVDAVFSCAVFHHIHDHDRLFARLHDALVPGGRLVAQCGGAGNIARFHAHAQEVARRAPFADYLAGMRSPWYYAGPEETSERLHAAGFVEVRCRLEPRPVRPAALHDFVGKVCLNYHAARLRELAGAQEGERLAAQFTEAVVRALGERPLIDYVRLNIQARARSAPECTGAGIHRGAEDASG